MARDRLIRDLERINSVTIDRIIDRAFSQNRGHNNNTNHGTWVATSSESLNNYICRYWRPHHAKQNEALKYLNKKNKVFFTQDVDIIDWGCGQGLSSISYIEFLRRSKRKLNIKNLTLIDASEMALNRAMYFCKRMMPELKPNAVVADLNLIQPENVPAYNSGRTIHFLSNILDMREVDYRQIFKSLISSQNGKSLVCCISTVVPNDPERNSRLGDFVQLFKDNFGNSYREYSRRMCKREGEKCRKCPEFVKVCHEKFKNRNWTRNEIIFEVELPQADKAKVIDFSAIYHPLPKTEPAQIFIEHYQAAYALDPIVEKAEYEKLRNYIASNSHFTITSKCINESQHSNNCSVYAVLANQVMRGLPTYLPINLARSISQKIHAMQEMEPLYGTLRYGFKDIWPQDFRSLDQPRKELMSACIEIARLQLSILVYLIHKEIKTHKLEIQILGSKKQAAIYAVDSLNFMLVNMSTLTGADLPELSLTQAKTSDLASEALIIHLRKSPGIDLPETECDNLAIDVLDYEFYDTHYQKRYFSTQLIQYQAFYDEETETFDQRFVNSLKYFLQSIFRKQDFIEGQLGILRHSLRLDSVIGLLPTGGGKSLTYQLSALLQPGFSLVIEPIRSLMKDQYDEMQLIGIDSIYINADISRELNSRNMLKMETGQALFTLISPERMQIQSFRDALIDMVAEDNYFSYFIVDEAHCVSEWGHDFRTSYLRLAANANRFCKPFDGSDISVIGLTATASFDVLTDVQTELEINSSKHIQIQKSPSLKREEIIYKFIPIKYKKGNYSARDLRFQVSSLKRLALTDLVKHSLEEDLHAANKKLGEQSKYSLAHEGQAGLKISNDTGIIVFCPHRAGILGVNTKPTSRGETIHGTFEHLEQELRDNTKIKAGYCRGSSEGDDPQDQRMSKFQEKFKDNKINLMVATKAFGMGFNKPNVRFSVHLNYPGSIEGFAQETGRVGRDRKLALSYLLYSDLDQEVPGFLHESNYPGIDKEIEMTRKILKYRNQGGKSINEILMESKRTRDFVIEIASDAAGFGDFRSKNYGTSLGKIIYRLALVGIIDDYTITYGRPIKYTLYVEAKSRKSLNETLKTYLLRYFTEKKAESKVEDFYRIYKGKPNYIDLIRYYIQFEYDFIKAKREQAIKDMDFAGRYGLANQEEDPLSGNFQEYMDVYFSSKYFRENYEVNGADASITRSTDRGKIESEEIVTKFIDIVKKDSGGLIPNCKELRGACIRLLNDNPRNFSLHILNAFTNLILSRKRNLEFNQGIKELIQGVGLYMHSKDKFIKFENFTRLLKSFWQEIIEEIPDFEGYLRDMTGITREELEQLLYLNRSAEILASMIQREK